MSGAVPEWRREAGRRGGARRRQATEWPDELTAEFVRLWRERPALSAEEIGHRLGVTKSAVLGKRRRLGLPLRVAAVRKDARPAAPPVVVPIVAGSPAPARFQVAARPVPCCWPLGDPAQPGFRFCGDPTAEARPYCPEHAGLAYVPVRQRDDSRSKPTISADSERESAANHGGGGRP